LAGQQTNTGTVTGQDVNSPPGTTVTDQLLRRRPGD
jgi:hypothetical protein